MYNGGIRPSQFKFNNLINEHFHQLIFFKSIFSRKNWRGGGELLLKNGTTKVTPTNLDIAWAGFTLRGALALEKFRNIFLPNIDENQKKI